MIEHGVWFLPVAGGSGLISLADAEDCPSIPGMMLLIYGGQKLRFALSCSEGDGTYTCRVARYVATQAASVRRCHVSRGQEAVSW